MCNIHGVEGEEGLAGNKIQWSDIAAEEIFRMLKWNSGTGSACCPRYCFL